MGGFDNGDAMKREAIEFLIALLKEGPVCTADIAAEAKAQQHTWRTIRRASDELKLIKRPGADLRWRWELPTKSLLSNLAKRDESCANLVPALNAVEVKKHTNKSTTTVNSLSARERWVAFLQSRTYLPIL